MPEGDTIFRTAATLSKAIGGKVVRRYRSPLPGGATAGDRLHGQRITLVEARGKYLLVHFEDGTVLLTHMRMTGSWHIYRPGERWQKSERAARVVIETDDFVAVCFAAPVVELLPRGELTRHSVLARLGPDILKDDFDVVTARERLRAHPDEPIGAALLMQSVLSGIGNVYKSEVLFLCRVDPLVKVADLTDETLDRLIARARELMLANVDGGPRTTTGLPMRAFMPRARPRYWVYDRRGEPCQECGSAIQATREGAEGVAARVTYYCPTCQPPGATGHVEPDKAPRGGP